MTFAGEKPLNERIMLSAELDSTAKEEKDFSNVTVVRTSEKALAGEKAAKITENQAVSSRVLKVQKGGSLALSAFATFDKGETTLAMAASPANRYKETILTGAASALSVQDLQIGHESKGKALNFNVLATLPLIILFYNYAINLYV